MTRKAKDKAPLPHFRDLADWSGTSPEQLVETHLAKIANTSRGYRKDLEVFAAWLKADTLADAARKLIDSGRASAKRLLIAWVNDMRTQRLAAKTICRRVASIKSMVTTAADPDIEVVTWQIGKLKNLPKPHRVRACGGPGIEVVERMFMTCVDRDDPKGRRDAAMLAMLFWHGRRREEVVSLRVEDVNLEERTYSVIAKCEQGRVTLGLCSKAADMLERWLEVRGDESGPLFLRCCTWGRRVMTGGLTGNGLYKIVRTIGTACGRRCWPHALRHAALSRLAMLTYGSAEWGMALSGHQDVSTWLGYQDKSISHVSAAEILSRGQIVHHDPSSVDN